MSCFVIALGYFLNGPCELLGESLAFMVIGHLISGCAMCYQSVYSITEITQRAAKVYPEKKEDVSDYSAGILNMFIGIGQAIGPVYGAHMVHSFNFKLTQDIVGIVAFIFGILYLFMADGISAFKSLKKKDSK